MLTFFGAGAVAAMLVCYMLEARSSWFIFAFGLACFGASAYGWLTGAWPFGVIEALWSILALRSWRRVARIGAHAANGGCRLSSPGARTWISLFSGRAS
jgi:hypothetical protein